MDAKLREHPDQFSKPVWCVKCCLRIAPYDLRTVFKGKDYHRHCFEKMVPKGEGSRRMGQPK